MNLQSADSIIMYDADWNPHQDLQAYSAHRFGQTKPVVIYKLLTLNSVEEKVAQIANKKLFLDHVVVERMNETKATNAEDADLFEFLSCEVAKLFENDNPTFTFDNEMLDELTNFDAVIQKYESTNTSEGGKGLANCGIFRDGFKFAKIWESATTSLAAEPVSTGADTSLASSPEYKSSSVENEEYFWSKFFIPDTDAEHQQQEELGIGKRKRKAILNDVDPSI